MTWADSEPVCHTPVSHSNRAHDTLAHLNEPAPTCAQHARVHHREVFGVLQLSRFAAHSLIEPPRQRNSVILVRPSVSHALRRPLNTFLALSPRAHMTLASASMAV